MSVSQERENLMSYTDEFSLSLNRELNFLRSLGFQVDSVILMGSLTMGISRLADRDDAISYLQPKLNPQSVYFNEDLQSLKDLQSLPVGVLDSDADLLILCPNVNEVISRLNKKYENDPHLEREHPDIWRLINHQNYQLLDPRFAMMDEEKYEYNYRIFSPRIPKAQVYVFDRDRFTRQLEGIDNMVGYIEELQEQSGDYPLSPEVLNWFGETTVFLQAILLGSPLIEGLMLPEVRIIAERYREWLDSAYEEFFQETRRKRTAAGLRNK
jgi:hypothetical protein